ncbi:hypothetical protein ACFPRL_07100 [Pseudoclavibacter helvolus]
MRAHAHPSARRGASPTSTGYPASSRAPAWTATASVLALRTCFSRVRVRRCWTALMTIAPTIST